MLAVLTPQSASLEPERFQIELIDGLCAALARWPAPPCLLRAPTGSGKTFVLSRVLEQVTAHTPTLWLWMVPYVNLVQQTQDAIAANCPGLSPVMLSQGRNQTPQAGQVWISTAAAVARARDRTKGYDADADDDTRTLAATVALARSQGLRIGLVVDEAHIGLDSTTEFGKFARWLKPEYLLAATATPNDERLNAFLGESGQSAFEQFAVSREEVVEARLNKRYIEAVIYDLRQSVQTVADLKRTVLQQAWKRHCKLKADLASAGVTLVPLLLVQVGNGDKAVEEAEKDLVSLCKVPPGCIGKHTADAPDPVLMAAIANDQSKEVLIFKQSAGTGFDAPRAFVLVSTKPVNDRDFAMQFLGRVMRVARRLRARFPKPRAIPPELDTAYVYLADAGSQQGFEEAVQRQMAVKNELQGQTERLYQRQTVSGGVHYSNRSTLQPPLDYGLALPEATLAPTGEPPGPSITMPVAQTALFGWESIDNGGPLDLVKPDSGAVAPVSAAVAGRRLSRTELLDDLRTNGIRAYPLRRDLPALPRGLKRERRPVLEGMEQVSRTAASRLPLPETLVRNAVRVALGKLKEKEIHTELVSLTRSEFEVQILTDRVALAAAARKALHTLPGCEEDDARVIVEVLANRLYAPLDEVFDLQDEDLRPDRKSRERYARDAALWVVYRETVALSELMQGLIASECVLEDAAPLPDAMLFPVEVALPHSSRNIYGVLPPTDEELLRSDNEVYADTRELLRERNESVKDGVIVFGRYDAGTKLNSDERRFALALDRAAFVVWWHRNPDRKNYAVSVVRGEHRNYFWPDFVVCLTHMPGDMPLPRLVETKHDTKDAAHKAVRIPGYYGKVLFLTQDRGRFCVVNDDGSVGARVGEDDAAGLLEWLLPTRPTTTPVG